MIEDKWLSNVRFTTVQSKADLSKVKSGSNGDFQLGELSRAINTDRINEITVRAWVEKAGTRKSTLVFCADIAHVVELTNTFRKYGVEARFVTGDTPKKLRSQTLDAFRDRQFPVLVNCGVFTEGTDIPSIDCVLLARPTKSRNLLVQMIGRGMRLYAGKEDCHVIDMVTSLASGIVTTPTLFGLDPAEMVEDADVTDMKEVKDKKQQEEERQRQLNEIVSRPTPNKPSTATTITFTDYDSLLDLIHDTSGERHIRAMSPFAWVQVGPDKYILSCPTGGFLTIENPGNSRFTVQVTRKLVGSSSKSPYARTRELASADNLEDVVHAGDTYAGQKFARRLLATDQAWRKKPASQGQVDFLNKLREDDNQLLPLEITKGTAMDMITKLKHGARAWYAKTSAAKIKAEKKAGRLEELKSREKVSVGRLAQ